MGMLSRRPWLPRALLAAVLLPVAVGFVGVPVYADPYVVDPYAAPPKAGSADAIIALGGIEETAATAYLLAEADVAPVLVISDPYVADRPPNIWRLCRSRPAGVTVMCFAPDPSTTRGEAEEVRRLAELNGWESVIVVAPTFHLSRARWIVGRCFDGEIAMVDTGKTFGPAVWTYQYLYQTAGFVKAAVFQRGC